MSHTLQLEGLNDSGKLIAGVSSALNTPDIITRRLFVTERVSGTRFLVNTGADVSLVPVLPQNRRNKSKVTLSAANGTPIATFGQKLLQLDLGLRCNFQWLFHIVEVSKPILGTDFLSHFNLLVDIRQERLMDGNTNQKVPGQIANISALQLSCLNSNLATPYRDLLNDFPSLTRSSISTKRHTTWNIARYHHPRSTSNRQGSSPRS